MASVFLLHLARFSSGFSSAKKPHLIYVLADDYGHHDTGFNSRAAGALPDADTVKTPTLDALAAEGVVLNRFYVYKFCSPTRSSFISGRYPLHVNVANRPSDESGAVDVRMTTIGDMMKKANYATSVAGKWHAGAYFESQLAINRGFDASLTFLNGNEDHYTQFFGILKGTDLTQDGIPARDKGNKGLYGGEFYSAHNVAAVNTFARNWNGAATKNDAAVTANATSPYVHGRENVGVPLDFGAGNDALFLYAPFQNTHSPYEVPDEYTRAAVTATANKKEYYGMIAFLDQAVKNLTDALKTHGMWDNTLLVFSADNGGEHTAAGNNFPLRGGKYTTFEGGSRVVAFSSGGLVEAAARGTQTKQLIHICDMWATFSALAGVPSWERGDPSPHAIAGDVPPIDSINVVAALTTKGGKSTRDEVAIDVGALAIGLDMKLIVNPGTEGKDFYTGPYWPAYSSNGSKAVKTAPAFRCSTKSPCLFNVTSDPNERTNLAGVPGMAAMLKKFLARNDVIAATAFQTGDDGYVPVNFTNCTTNAAFKAANGGFLGPLCYECTDPSSSQCSGPVGPTPTPPGPAPKGGVTVASVGFPGQCLAPVKIGKQAAVLLVACNDSLAAVWSISAKGVVATSDNKLCLRPTQPPKIPADCKAGTALMIGENACLTPSAVSGTINLASHDCAGFCADGAKGPVLAKCDAGSETQKWTVK